MIKSSTVDVFVKLTHGILIGRETFAIPKNGASLAMDGYSPRRHLKQGLNENVPRHEIESWLKQNSNLSCVRRGEVQIIDSDKLAKDIPR